MLTEAMVDIIFAGLAVLVLVLGATIYNRLIVLNRRCDQAGADIDVQLKLRHDLVPVLVETVRGYAGHEQTALEAVIKARAAAVAAPQGPARTEAEGLLGAALGRLMMVVEAYPDLKAQTNFGALQAELSDIENKIAAARRFQNAALTEYNTTREQFPANLVAATFAFKSREMAAVLPDERLILDTAPAVRF